MKKIVLASTSTYRRDLLCKLGISFTQSAPTCKEEGIIGDSVKDTAILRGVAKANSLLSNFSDALIIASDQTAEVNGQMLGKPGNFEAATSQLEFCSGQKVNFYTSICLACTNTGRIVHDIDTTTVHFRTLTTSQIRRYLSIDQPYDCTGSFKVEALGIRLFTCIESTDPNALIGLPLIRLCSLFIACGIELDDYTTNGLPF